MSHFHCCDEAAEATSEPLDVDDLAGALIAAHFEHYLDLAEHMSGREVAEFIAARLRDKEEQR